MQLTVIQRVVGLLLMLFSFSMLPPVLVGLIYGDGGVVAFLDGFAVTFFMGLILWLPVFREQRELRLRDGFMVVVMAWLVLGILGAVPLLLDEHLNISVTDAVFESISGLTTTGATVITGLDDLPHSILFYRQQLQWMGGMGIIVLAVAVLPMLGVGGMQLYRAETPGPVKDTKLTPRITETAKALWYVYLGVSLACALAYWAAGMDVFDAVGHSFATVATGGFSTHDASLGYYHNPLLEMVSVVFMFFGGVNFGLHFMAIRDQSLRAYSGDPEFRAYLILFIVVSAITVAYLYFSDIFRDIPTALRHGVFQAVSIGTTTGFTSSDYYVWPGFLPVLLLFGSFVGGCAGSTGGGIKVIRFLLLIKQGARELRRLVHPNAQMPVKIGRRALSERVIEAVWGFFSAYVAVFVIMMLLMMAAGYDQVTAYSAVAACINNLGPGLGDVGQTYGDLKDSIKWLLAIAMILGRLEIFTLLVLLTPDYWRK
jgi:trk system potassium uptake protein TrkH